MNVNGPAETAQLRLGDGQFDLSADLTLGKTAEFSQTGAASVTFDGNNLTIIRSKILGGIFGDTAGEAGVLFGLADDQGWVFSGGANGVLTP